MKNLFYLLAALAAIAAIDNHPIFAAGDASAAIHDQPVFATGDVVATGAWQHDAALKAPVSFEVKQYSLITLLKYLQEQSGITLTADAEITAANLLVTAYVQDKALADIMAALAHLYAAEWTKKSDREYMLGNRLQGLERELIRQGNMPTIDSQYSLLTPDPRLTWMKPLYQFMRDKPGRIPIATAPEDIQALLRAELQRNASSKIIEKSQGALLRTIEGYIIQLRCITPIVTINGKLQPPDPLNQRIRMEVLKANRIETGVILDMKAPGPAATPTQE